MCAQAARHDVSCLKHEAPESCHLRKFKARVASFWCPLASGALSVILLAPPMISQALSPSCTCGGSPAAGSLANVISRVRLRLARQDLLFAWPLFSLLSCSALRSSWRMGRFIVTTGSRSPSLVAAHTRTSVPRSVPRKVCKTLAGNYRCFSRRRESLDVLKALLKKSFAPPVVKASPDHSVCRRHTAHDPGWVLCVACDRRQHGRRQVEAENNLLHRAEGGTLRLLGPAKFPVQWGLTSLAARNTQPAVSSKTSSHQPLLKPGTMTDTVSVWCAGWWQQGFTVCCPSTRRAVPESWPNQQNGASNTRLLLFCRRLLLLFLRAPYTGTRWHPQT